MDDAQINPPAAADALAYEAPRAVAVPAAEIGALALRLLGVKLIVDALSALPWVATLAFGTRGDESVAARRSSGRSRPPSWPSPCSGSRGRWRRSSAGRRGWC